MNNIKKKAKKEGRRLVFQDECAVRLLASVKRTYSIVGCPKEISCDAKNKEYISISGIICDDGFCYFEVREKEGFKQKGLIRFLKNAHKTSQDDLLVVWDNAPSHKSETVKDFLSTQNPERPAIWVENIPPYSPELNPIELVWAYLKDKLANCVAKNTSELKKMVYAELDKLMKDKEKIQSFFKHEELKCYHFFI